MNFKTDYAMIQFKQNYSMKNGNKITKKNWHKVVAVSDKPCTNVLGVAEIDRYKSEKGFYYERWVLSYEEGEFGAGYIFREIHHRGGINGIHKTPKEAIWRAMDHRHISVHLED